MQQREKILASLLGAVVLFWFGMPIFSSYFIQPIKDLEATRERLQKDSIAKIAQQTELAKRGKILADWKRTSLPPKPNDAARLYQEWLTEIALMSGFEQDEYTLETRQKKDETFYRIPVTIQAEATLQELAQFIERFESVDLLHRIKTCNVKSPRADGNPELEVTITAEGLAVQTAENRNELFPQVSISQALDKDATQVALDDDFSDFPEKAPFQVRIGDEFINVTEVNENQWTLQRGVAQTFASEHPEGATIELFPLVEETEASQEQVQNLWSDSLFTKPAPYVDYQPRLASSSIPPAIRGEKYEQKLEVESWDPAFGDPRLTLLKSPDGMDIDERTGIITWPVSATAEMGEEQLEVVVWGSASKEGGFAETLNLRVRDPNVPPKLESNDKLRFFLGRQTEVKLKSDDPDGDKSQLKYKLEDGPEGMSIGESDGVIRWTPPESMEPQDLTIRVTITDGDELPASTTVSLPASVEEDSARFAFFVGSFTKTINEDQIVKQAWIFDRATNQNTTISEGQSFKIADFEMTVAEIGPDFLKLRRDDGLYQLRFEQPLHQMVKIDVPANDYNPPPTSNSEESTESNESTGGTSKDETDKAGEENPEPTQNDPIAESVQ